MLRILSVFLAITCAAFAVQVQSTRAPNRTVNVTGGGGGGYLLQEDFTGGSGTTPPSGWTNDGGTWNYSNTSPSLPQGGNNASGNAGAANQTWKAFTTQSECWAYFQFNVASLAIGGTRDIFDLEDSSGVKQAYVRLVTDGTLQIWDAASEASATTAAISANTNYHVWVHYKKGTGAGVIDVAFSTSGTRPTSGTAFATRTDVSTNVGVSRVGIVLNDNSVTQYFDHVLVSTSQIGDNP